MKWAWWFAAVLVLNGCTSTSPTKPQAIDLILQPPGETDPEGLVESALFELLDDAGFAGVAAFSSEPRRKNLVHVDDGAFVARGQPDRPWPWASVTKQVVAVLMMQQVEAGTLTLDSPVSDWIALDGAASPTIRQLLQHGSGLRNPDDSPVDANGVPDFYSTGPSGVEWCLAGRSAPPAGGWSYNNCDYIVLGAVLKSVTGRPISALFGERLRAAGVQGPMLATRRPRSLARSGAEFPFDISRYGASAGILGSVNDILAFDRALLDGRFLSPEARTEMWDSDPALGYMALGQWVYEVPLSGCDGVVRIVERRGAIGGYQLRNFILPEMDMALVIAVKDESFDFGDLWQQQGRSFDILSAAACGDAT